MNRFRPAALLPLALVLGAAEAAPPPAPAPAPASPEASQSDLALDGAIRLALARNEGPQVAAARIAGAEASLRRASAAVLPAVTLRGSLATADRDRFPHGGPADETATWAATAELAILRARAWSALSAAQYALRAQQLDSLEQDRALAYAVSDVYLSLIAARSQAEAAERRLRVAESSVADAKALLDAGVSTKTFVTRAELEAATARLALTRARNLATTVGLALADLIVAPNITGLAAPPEIAVPSRESEVLLRLAVAMRPDLGALRHREAAAEQNVRAAYARWAPDLTARVQVGGYETTDPVRVAGEGTTEVVLSLIATWTLYDGGDRGGAIGEARAAGREATLTYTGRMRSLRRDLLGGLADLDTAEAALAQAEARDRLARANAEEVRARLKQGLATALEDADAISSQYEAESGLVAARLDLARSQLELRRLAGMWPLTDRVPAARR